MDTYGDERSFLFYEDDRFSGYVVLNTDDTTEVITSGADFEKQGRIREYKKYVKKPEMMTAEEIKKWDLIVWFEHFFWPGYLAADGQMVTDTLNATQRKTYGIYPMVSWGAVKSNAQTAVDNYVNSSTKAKYNALGITEIPIGFENFAGGLPAADDEEILTTFQDWKTRYPKDVKRAFSDCANILLSDKFERFDIMISPGLIRCTYGSREWPINRWAHAFSTRIQEPEDRAEVLYDAAIEAAKMSYTKKVR